MHGKLWLVSRKRLLARPCFRKAQIEVALQDENILFSPLNLCLLFIFKIPAKNSEDPDLMRPQRCWHPNRATSSAGLQSGEDATPQ